MAQPGEVLPRDHVDDVECVAAGEGRVLVVREEREHARDSGGEHEGTPIGKPRVHEQPAGRVGDRRRSRHQRREPPVGVGVEVVGGRDDEEQPQAVPRDGEVRRGDEREEAEEERKAVEEHAGGSTVSRRGG